MAHVTGTDRPESYQVADGHDIRLGGVLAKAGEGTIHTVVGRPDLAVKIFHPTLNGLSEKLEKVVAMVASPPSGATQVDGFAVLSWPTDVVRLGDRAVGYVMPRIDTENSVEIHALSNPSNRSNPLANSPQWPVHATWSHLLTVAANLCVAVDVVHHVDAVVGDFQERNILVTDTSRVALVDCDSMQFTDKDGRVFTCAVGRPEFSPPELLGHDLATTVRRKDSDLFALAIHIYLLLMAGNHPFLRGNWQGQGEQPGVMELAKTGDWAGGRNSRLQTHRLAPPVTYLPSTVVRLFARAFTVGSTRPSARPTAAEWHAALLDITVRNCPGGAHQVPVDTAVCPWCTIDDERVRQRKSSPLRQQTVHQIVAPPPGQPQHLSAPKSLPPKKVQPGPRSSATSTTVPRVPAPTARSTKKSRPPFKSTTAPKTKKGQQQSGDLSEELGRALYRLFLIIGIPIAISLVIMVVWIVAYAIHRL